MTYTKPFFIWDNRKSDVVDYANMLMQHFGKIAKKDADVIISVGGDGNLLDSIDQSMGTGLAVYGITPPDSTSSAGFLTDHDVRTPEDLQQRLDQAYKTALPALKGTVKFQDGTVIEQATYSDITLKAVSLERLQAAVIDIRTEFNSSSGKSVSDTLRFTGDGIVFSTPIASTGYNASNGGAIMDLTYPGIALSGISPYAPKTMRSNTAVFSPDTQFHVVPPASSLDKRALAVLIGGTHDLLSAEKQGSPITELHVERVPDMDGTLLTSKHPTILVFNALRPK